MKFVLPCLALLALSSQEPPKKSSPESVDLLKLIDPVKDSVRGNWVKGPAGLLSPGRSFSRIVVPYVPPEEYDVTLVAERRGESNSVNLGLAVGDVQFMVILDAYINSVYTSGIELIDGKGFYANETTTRKALFTTGKPHTVVCSIRKDRIAVSVDGKPVIDWKADYKRLSLFSGWAVPHKTCLLVGSWTSVVRIEKIELRPVTGKGRPLNRFTAPPPASVRLTEKEARAKIAQLIEKLDSRSVDDRAAADAELGSLPLRYLPLVQEYARKKKSAEVTFRVGALSVPEPWPRILGGSIREAGKTLGIVLGEGPQRETAVGNALAGLAVLPGKEARPILESFLRSGNPSLVELALKGYTLHAPKDPGKIVELLKRGPTSKSAADVLVALGDESLRPAVMEVLEGGQEPQADYAARVLRSLGPGKDLAHFVGIIENPDKLVLQPRVITILGISGTPDAQDALLGILAKNHPLDEVILRELSTFSDETASPAIHEYLASHPDLKSRDALRYSFRRREWALETLRTYRADSGKKFVFLSVPRIAAAGGPSLRDEVLSWIQDPKTRVSVKKDLLPLLGAVGRREDGKFLAAILKDSRLADGAGQGLDMLGDPAQAGPIMAAYLRSGFTMNLGPAVLSHPSETLQDDLAEILADPGGYGLKTSVAMRLAERNFTPRIRKILLEGLVGGGIEWTSSRGEALRLLSGTMKKEDLPVVAPLRNHARATEQATGLLLAVRAADPDAPAELAGLLAREEFISIPYRGKPRELQALRLMDWARPAGAAWKEAVRSQWKARPGWVDGAVWLAVEGDAEALEFVRSRLSLYPESLKRHLFSKLSEKGDPLGLAGMIDLALARKPFTSEEEERFVEGADPETRLRVIALARAQRHHRSAPIIRLAGLLAEPRAANYYRHLLLSDANSLSSSWGSTVLPPALRALGTLKTPGTDAVARRYLRSQDPRLRAAAAETAALLGDRKAIPYLIRLVDDPHPVSPAHRNSYTLAPVRRVWHAAMEAIEKLTQVVPEGASVADRREFWRSWYARSGKDGK